MKKLFNEFDNSSEENISNVSENSISSTEQNLINNNEDDSNNLDKKKGLYGIKIHALLILLFQYLYIRYILI